MEEEADKQNRFGEPNTCLEAGWVSKEDADKQNRFGEPNTCLGAAGWVRNRDQKLA